MNKELTLKSLRESYSEVANQKTDGYNRENVHKKRNQLKITDLTVKDYSRMVHFNLVEIALGEQALEEYRHKRGFLGSTDHMFIARKLLLARLHLKAVKLAMARSKIYQPNDAMKPTANGRITADHIEIDTPLLSDNATPHFCYVLVIENDIKIVATRPTKPNRQGTLVFPGCMVFDHQTCDFHLKMSLYKLALVEPPIQSWTKKIQKLWKGVQIPQFELVGYRTLSMTNISKKIFHFTNATLYIQFRITVGTGIRPLHTPVSVGGMLHNTFFFGGRLAVLQDTDLKLYKTVGDLQVGKIDFVMSLFRCQTCDIYVANEILRLKTVGNNEFLVYLPSERAQILWQNAFNFAIIASEKWRRAL